MKNKYVDFISDDHFLKCVGQLHDSYLNAKSKITKRKFYKNKVDTIKLTFDSKFNEIDEASLIEAEILRQIDKSINNFIGTFHEQILGGIKGFEMGKLSGYDIRAKDNTLFADIKNKHNTVNSGSAESLYQKLKQLADTHTKSKCYWVQILAQGSFNEKWVSIINRKEYSHSRVYKISGDRFYALLSGQEDAFARLYSALPLVIADYLKSLDNNEDLAQNSALAEIREDTLKTKRSILDQITG